MSKPQPAWLRLLLLCGFLLLGACSSTSFVYNRLDFLVPWYLDDYTNLDRRQERHLDELLEPFLVWHRKEELPRYVGLLEVIEQKLDAPVSAGDLALVVEDFRQAWLRIEDQGLEWMLALGETLTDEQVAEFIASLREQNKELADKYLPRDDQQYYEDSYENLRDNAADYVGRLTKTQRRALEEASKKLQRSDSQWLAEQSAWIDQLEHLLEREEGWQLRVRNAVATRQENAPEPYRRALAHNTNVITQAVAGLLNTLGEKQERHLARKLARLREDLVELASGA